jgi:transposase-like protein
MFKVPHQVYTAEFKEAAVQRVKDGQGVSAVARVGYVDADAAQLAEGF